MMTEKEKSLQGYMYNPMEEGLVQDRKIAKDLYFEYNHTLPSNYEKRTDIMKKLLGEIKGNFLIEQPFYCTYGYNISVGNNFFRI
ncbi:maltose acetyltransferase domain-containing protein [Paenibacillus thiaminolyticus]|uniref:maltose acetyltransferase domain-containing protein n=1 Tax=Paenibacillus thiaminolyticus TaxID=49283 RepID=UPI0035A5B8B2